MKLLCKLSDIDSRHSALVGGKACSLSALAQNGYRVPHTVCLPVEVYRDYVSASGLEEQIFMELGRKDFADMRWEEIWDAALRIRSLFLRTPLPRALETELHQELELAFAKGAVVVRSSSPGEDSARTSFAGLHESIVNVEGPGRIIDAIRRVWSSLWSDRALLYRQELNLDVKKSAMAVVIQHLVRGQCSGVAFSQSPVDPARAVVESVWGLNQGLVDGSVEPDHWELCRKTGQILTRQAPQRQLMLIPGPEGVISSPLDSDFQQRSPLSDQMVRHLAQMSLKLEELFACPQDVEWTLQDGEVCLLQARPVTARAKNGDSDPRAGFLSLHRSFENLKQLRLTIEHELIPEMEAAAKRMEAVEPSTLSDVELAAEIGKRRQTMAEWEGQYKTYCIPMAHGVRLFGLFYNDLVQPDDPFAFVTLLRGTGMKALSRNKGLLELAGMVGKDLELQKELGRFPGKPLPEPFMAQLDRLAAEFGISWCPEGQKNSALVSIIHLVLEMAKGRHQPAKEGSAGQIMLQDYFSRFTADERGRAEELLDLARASYRLRDDDNISMGKIRHQLNKAEDEGRFRLAAGKAGATLKAVFDQASKQVFHPASRGRESHRHGPPETALGQVRMRQFQGQPAGPGVATGVARVIHGENELGHFKSGEILVCDAIDPAMTFVVPLAAAIVERRGGMLIHGAIIAREYGIPCVTGLVDATELIQTGDTLTVDGYLGIVARE